MQTSQSLRDFEAILTAFADVNEFLRGEIGGEVSHNQLTVLGRIIQAEVQGRPVTMRDLSLELDIPRNSISRYVAQLTAEGSGGKPGYGFVQQRAGEADKRLKYVTLTEAGVEFALRFATRIRNEAFKHRATVLELFEQSNTSSTIGVLAAFDVRHQVNVFQVATEFSVAKYRQIMWRLAADDGHRLICHDIIDITDARKLDLEPEDLQTIVAFGAAFEPFTEKKVCIVCGPKLIDLGRDFAEQLRGSDIENILFHRNLDETRIELGLPRDWVMPPLRAL